MQDFRGMLNNVKKFIDEWKNKQCIQNYRKAS
jgi:hypothetical protein